MAELLSKGIKLEVSEDGTKWKSLYGLTNVPDMGADVEKIEITNLADANKRYIDGIMDYGDLTYEFFYNKETTPDPSDASLVKESYNVLRSYQIAGKTVHFRVVYPDNTGHSYQGTCNVKRKAAGVNEALGFTLTTALSSEMTDVTITN